MSCRSPQLLCMAREQTKIPFVAGIDAQGTPCVCFFQAHCCVSSFELQKYKHTTHAGNLPATRSGINTKLRWHDCQGSALAREAMSSAAVTLYAAAVLPGVPPSVSATDLASGLFLPPDSVVRFAALGPSGELAPYIVLLHATVSTSAG